MYLLPVYSQDYSYKVFSEDGIYVRNIKNDKYEPQENYDDDNPPVIENIDRKKSNDTNGDSRIDDLHNKNEQLLKELNNE